MKEEFIIKKNFGTARYFRTASEAFKGADYANPYSCFKPAPKVDIASVIGTVVGLAICLSSIWLFL